MAYREFQVLVDYFLVHSLWHNSGIQLLPGKQVELKAWISHKLRVRCNVLKQASVVPPMCIRIALQAAAGLTCGLVI